ncbi:DUF2243 domain-containing protein [Agrobacterium rosae]
MHKMPRRYWLSGFLVGVSAAGFVDGIVLHQILQWHSLLSGLKGQPFDDLRFRMLMDGGFHLAMYAVAMMGLFMLFHQRRHINQPGSERFFVSALMVGFGTWHVTDALLNHWLLRLHHIRETENWLWWDLGFFVMGVAVALTGLILRRRPPSGGRGLGTATASMIALLLLSSATVSAVPWKQSNIVTVVFRPDITTSQIQRAIFKTDAPIVWSNSIGDVWALSLDGGSAFKLYREGALFVSGSYFGIGCFTGGNPATKT